MSYLKIRFLFVLMFLTTACKHDGSNYSCTNGECICADGYDCEISCAAPPCTVSCFDKGTQCEAECANGDCTCGVGAVCDFGCVSGPCHVNCEGNDWCSGVCDNGDCNCSSGSTCLFDCLSGPCHVNCEGNNPMCDGVCANGTCNCGSGSVCKFDCLDNDCQINCESEAQCVLHCPDNNAGSQGCSISKCTDGELTICPNGEFTTCNAPCPEPKVDSDT